MAVELGDGGVEWSQTLADARLQYRTLHGAQYEPGEGAPVEIVGKTAAHFFEQGLHGVGPLGEELRQSSSNLGVAGGKFRRQGPEW